MTAEQIVRALAATDPITSDDGYCGLCDRGGGEHRMGDHEPDCPWRLAVEWVAAQETAAAPAGEQIEANHPVIMRLSIEALTLLIEGFDLAGDGQSDPFTNAERERVAAELQPHMDEVAAYGRAHRGWSDIRLGSP